MEEKQIFDTVEEAIEDIKNGKMVIIADDECRENEGDLVCAAEIITPEIINFMVTQARGVVCLSMTEEKARELDLHQMVDNNTSELTTAFTVSIDASRKFGVTTGVSASDRATTVKIATEDRAKPEDLRRPGHIFPLVAKKGGVLKRVGQTEASVDIARLAGLKPMGVICEIMNEDGTMARRNDLRKFADKHNIKFITVAQMISYRLRHECFIKKEAEATLPTEFGSFKIYGYRNTLDNTEHVALVKGENEDHEGKIPYVRMHSECLTGDALHSLRCDCGSQLNNAMKFINEKGYGAIVYLRSHEGRGIGLVNKIKAYALQDKGRDTIEANIELGFESDLRDYGTGAQILRDLGFTKINLITNNPKKIIGLEGYDLEIVDTVHLPTCLNPYNEKYIRTKCEKMHHTIKLGE